MVYLNIGLNKKELEKLNALAKKENIPFTTYIKKEIGLQMYKPWDTDRVTLNLSDEDLHAIYEHIGDYPSSITIKKHLGVYDPVKSRTTIKERIDEWKKTTN